MRQEEAADKTAKLWCARLNTYLLHFVACTGARVGMELPSVEVRFKDLHIDTPLYSESGRNLPTIFNAYRDALEVRQRPALFMLPLLGRSLSLCCYHLA